jgi:hypothetical protein
MYLICAKENSLVGVNAQEYEVCLGLRNVSVWNKRIIVSSSVGGLWIALSCLKIVLLLRALN